MNVFKCNNAGERGVKMEGGRNREFDDAGWDDQRSRGG